ncbi:MAG: T9SS type A sorting domain-containing protein [Chitinophagaceae bacterium]|nr:T9SS type A sorting domain-containing protein [Chitinophagaceae bacterium]
MRLQILRISFFVVYALLNWNKVSFSQCPGGKPLQTVTYSNTGNLGSLTDSIYFAGKFDPALGTIVSAEMSISTLGYALLEVINDVGAPITYKITYFRTDYINGPGLGAGGIMLDTFIVYPGITIGASDSPAVATSTPPWASNGPNKDNSNVWGTIQASPVFSDTTGDHPREFHQTIDSADFPLFTGSGPLIYYYDVVASLLAQGVGGRYTQRIVTLNTQYTISTTYTYCPMNILPQGKLTFSAKKVDDHNIRLNWVKETEVDGITYTPEVSRDGYSFSPLENVESKVPETPSTVVKYEYGYAVPKSSPGKFYFRLRQADASGQILYSAISTVNMISIPVESETLTLFPNPAGEQVNLRFPAIQKHDLLAELLTTTGQIVERKQISANGSEQYLFNFTRRHQPGIYFIRVTDNVSKTRLTGRLVIR